MQFFDRERGQHAELFEDIFILERQRFEDAANQFGVRLRHGLPARSAIVADRGRHAGRIRERGIVRVDKRAKLGSLPGHLHDLRVGIFGAFLFPLLDALLQNPHPGDILQQTRGSLDSAFVRDVQRSGLVGNHRVFHLDAHQRPGSGTQVCELFIGCGHSGYGRSGIVTGHGHHRNLIEPRLCGQRIGQRTDHGTRRHHFAEQRTLDAHLFEQLRLHLLGSRIEYLGGRSDRVFGRHLAGKHITQRIGHEQRTDGGFQRRRMVALHRIELVQAVEIHHLNTGEVIDLLTRHDLCEILLGSARGMQIPVCQGHPQNLAVFADQREVDAPRVDTDRRDFRSFLRTGDHPGL